MIQKSLEIISRDFLVNLECSRLLYENLNNVKRNREVLGAVGKGKGLIVEQAFAYKVCGILEP